MMCNIKLTRKTALIIPKIIFCVLCVFFSPQCSHVHLQSREIRYHDIPSIIPENINNHGSIQCGNK